MVYLQEFLKQWVRPDSLKAALIFLCQRFIVCQSRKPGLSSGFSNFVGILFGDGIRVVEDTDSAFFAILNNNISEFTEMLIKLISSS